MICACNRKPKYSSKTTMNRLANSCAFTVYDHIMFTKLNAWTVLSVFGIFCFEGRMFRLSVLGDYTVLAFSAFAGVQVPAAAGPCAVVLMNKLLVAEVAQLHGLGDRLTQEVSLIVRVGRRGTGGAPAVVVVVLIPGVLVQAGAAACPGILQRQIGRGPGTLPEGLRLISSNCARSKPVPGAPWRWETVVIFTHAQQRSFLWARSSIGHQIEGVLRAGATGPAEMMVVVPTPLGSSFGSADMNICCSSTSATDTTDVALADRWKAGGIDVTRQTQPVLFLEDETRR